MELNEMEITAVTDVMTQTNERYMVELGDLQLTIVGGGSGEIVLS